MFVKQRGRFIPAMNDGDESPFVCNRHDSRRSAGDQEALSRAGAFRRRPHVQALSSPSTTWRSSDLLLWRVGPWLLPWEVSILPLLRCPAVAPMLPLA